MNKSLTLPPATLKNAAPANPLRNRKTRKTATIAVETFIKKQISVSTVERLFSAVIDPSGNQAAACAVMDDEMSDTHWADHTKTYRDNILERVCICFV